MSKFNLKKDDTDVRDFRLRSLSSSQRPTIVDLRPNMPIIYDQGILNSCTAQAVASVHHYTQLRQNRIAFSPSRLFLWWNTRAVYDETDLNEGATLRDTIKSLAHQGICPESMWPYNPSSFRRRPEQNCYTTAMLYQADMYARVRQTQQELETVLSQRMPIVFGMLIFQSFESTLVARTGNVPVPNVRREALLGGHAMVIVGYNSTTRQFIVRNSWGTQWGQRGHCFIPYSLILNPNLVFDLWVVSRVENGPIVVENRR